MPTVREGDRISNYLLESRIGSGSFGEVWRARHHVFSDVVAIKIPTDPQYVRNLQREGVAIHGLHHPNIVRAIDLDPYADPPYLVMEYVAGPSLREVIDSCKPELPVDAAVAIVRGILNALVAAHGRGLVHRDIKPANVLIDHPLDEIGSVGEQAVKVTDFGLGRVGGETTRSIMQSGSMLTEDGHSVEGTLAYMAPEQKEGGEVDARSDLYSCGVVLFELLTGERPQGGDLPSSVRTSVPRALDQIFLRCYTRLDRRFGSAGEMLTALALRTEPPLLPLGSSPVSTSGPSCPACGDAILGDDHFCIHCGHQLVASVPRCPSCRAFVNSADRFCIFCGNNLMVMEQ